MKNTDACILEGQRTCDTLFGQTICKCCQPFVREGWHFKFELYKTDIIMHTEDFIHLTSINATTFKESLKFEDVEHMARILLDAYDIMKQHNIVDARTLRQMMLDDKFKALSPASLYDKMDHMMFNINENVATFIRADELPEYTDSVLTINEWNSFAEYDTQTIDTLCNLFHGKRFKYRAFKDLYLTEPKSS